MLFQFGTVYFQLQMIQQDVLTGKPEVLAAKNKHTRSVQVAFKSLIKM